MQALWTHVAHPPGSMGALMDPEQLRRAVDDADPPFVNDHPAPVLAVAWWREVYDRMLELARRSH
ncbi:MAG TPA: hypothetical protein VIO33_15075 [Burkholderiaceae bacterium]